MNNPLNSWKPVLPSALHTKGNYQLTSSSQVLADPLLVLHFILNSISLKGNPACMISEMLSAFLLDDSFLYKEIVFNVGTDESVLEYSDNIEVLVSSLER